MKTISVCLLLVSFSFFNFEENIMPQNDECLDATIMNISPLLTCQGFQNFGTTQGATPSVQTDCTNLLKNNDVWFSFTTTTHITQFTLNSLFTGQTNNFSLSIYEGSCSFLIPNLCTGIISDDYEVGLFGTPGITLYVQVLAASTSPTDYFEFEICVSEKCFDNLTLSGPNPGGITSNDYEAIGLIESIETIQSGAVVDYDSETEILLNEGFEVELNATFEAIIDGCNDGAGGSHTYLLNQSEEDSYIESLPDNLFLLEENRFLNK